MGILPIYLANSMEDIFQVSRLDVVEAVLISLGRFKDLLRIALPDGLLQNLRHFCLVESMKHRS